VSISSIDTLDLFTAILFAAIVADSRLGPSLSKITFRFIDADFDQCYSDKLTLYIYILLKIG
jgi:hypothetical protein